MTWVPGFDGQMPVTKCQSFFYLTSASPVLRNIPGLDALDEPGFASRCNLIRSLGHHRRRVHCQGMSGVRTGKIASVISTTGTRDGAMLQELFWFGW